MLPLFLRFIQLLGNVALGLDIANNLKPIITEIRDKNFSTDKFIASFKSDPTSVIGLILDAIAFKCFNTQSEFLKYGIGSINVGLISGNDHFRK